MISQVVQTDVDTGQEELHDPQQIIPELAEQMGYTAEQLKSELRNKRGITLAGQNYRLRELH